MTSLMMAVSPSVRQSVSLSVCRSVVGGITVVNGYTNSTGVIHLKFYLQVSNKMLWNLTFLGNFVCVQDFDKSTDQN